MSLYGPSNTFTRLAACTWCVTTQAQRIPLVVNCGYNAGIAGVKVVMFVKHIHLLVNSMGSNFGCVGAAEFRIAGLGD